MIAFFAAVTCTFGNLAAYGQDNMKRLLAYSTIAHAGYMMMPRRGRRPFGWLRSGCLATGRGVRRFLHCHLLADESRRIRHRRLPPQ